MFSLWENFGLIGVCLGGGFLPASRSFTLALIIAQVPNAKIFENSTFDDIRKISTINSRSFISNRDFTATLISKFFLLTLRLSGGTRESHRFKNRYFGKTLFLNQFHDFSLLSWNSFLHPFLKSNLTRKAKNGRTKIHLAGNHGLTR